MPHLYLSNNKKDNVPEYTHPHVTRLQAEVLYRLKLKSNTKDLFLHPIKFPVISLKNSMSCLLVHSVPKILLMLSLNGTRGRRQ